MVALNDTTKYCYDGDQVIAEFNESDIIQRRFFYGPGIDEPICMYAGTLGQYYYYHYDGLGSVVALTDSDGAVVETYSYDAFGGPTIRNSAGMVISESSVGNPYMFTGRRLDDETGLYYYRARYYNPSIGRFISRDPILVPIIDFRGHFWMLEILMSRPHALTPYTYCINNPINLLDPEGLKPQTPGCDLFPDFLETACVGGCCDQHDYCYVVNNCDMSSWWSDSDDCPLAAEDCDRCNKQVVSCIRRCIFW